MSTLSCSTTLRAARIAESGLASVAPMTTSISRPPAMAPNLFIATRNPRNPVLAEDGVGSLQRGQEADLQRVRGEGRACTAERERESESGRANQTFAHCSPLPKVCPLVVARRKNHRRVVDGVGMHAASCRQRPRCLPSPEMCHAALRRVYPERIAALNDSPAAGGPGRARARRFNPPDPAARSPAARWPARARAPGPPPSAP